jgi:predicted nucleotide-binding protein
MPLIKKYEAFMSLPIRTTLDDVDALCRFLGKKPTGASVAEAKKVLDAKFLDGRKLSALKVWGFIDDQSDGRLKITEAGRQLTRDSAEREKALLRAIGRVAPYKAVVERAAHRNESSISATDVAAHWHEHFADETSDSDRILNDQAVCFFQLAAGANLGILIVGRKGALTRFEFDLSAIRSFAEGREEGEDEIPAAESIGDKEKKLVAEVARPASPSEAGVSPSLGQAIFVAHGKNKKPLEQLKRILDQFKIPHKVATEEPNLGRPIGAKVREIMESCNCAILIFTGDEEFLGAEGNTLWRPSENVVFELGAAGYLYGSRIVIMKEELVQFPTNFRELGYISFAKDQLEAKAMEILKELIGFGIVKVST